MTSPPPAPVASARRDAPAAHPPAPPTDAVHRFTYRWDVASGHVERSAGFAALLGYPPDEAEPSVAWWQARVHPDDLHDVLRAGQRTFGDPAVSECPATYRARHRDGTYRWLEDHAWLARDLDGRVTTVLGVTIDVTASHAAHARADALQRLGAALAAASTRDDVAHVIAAHTVDALGALAGAVFALDDPPDALRPLSAVGYPDEVRARFPRVPLALPYPATDTARTRQPIFIGSRAEWDAAYTTRPSTTTSGSDDGAWAALPLDVEGRLCGVLVLTYGAPRTFAPDDRAFMAAFAALGAQALGRARLLDAEREARARVERLQAITATLAGATTEDAVAEALLGHLDAVLQPNVAAMFRLTDDGGEPVLEMLRAGGAGAVSATRFARIPLGADVPLAAIVRDGDSVFVEDAAAFAARYPQWPASARAVQPSEAWVGIALVGAMGTRLGAVTFGFATPRHFDAEERRYVEALTHQGTQALERARLLAAERRLRAAAEGDALRVSELQGLTTALAGAITPEDVAEVALERARPAFGAAAGLFNLLTEDGQYLVQLRTSGFPDAVWRPWHRYPVAAGTPGSMVVKTGEPVFVGSFAETAARFPVILDTVVRAGSASYACLPLVGGGAVLGFVAFNFTEEREFSAAVREQMRAFAGQGALALARARLYDAERSARARAEELSDRLGDVLETMSDALFEYDREWRLTRVNAAARVALRAAALEPDAALGRTLWDLTPGADARPEGEQLRRAMAGERVRFRTYSSSRARWLETRAFPTRTGVATYVRDVDAEVRAEMRLRLLADAGRVLVAALDPQGTLDAIGKLVVPALADGCTIDLVRDGVMERVVCLHRDPAKAELLAESARRNPAAFSRMAPPLLDRLSAGRGLVLQELRPEAFDALVPDPYQRDAIVRVGIQSYILVPLRIGDRLLGALGLLVSESARRYDDEDLALAEELARRSAVAMENARLYAAERAARGEAEASNRAKMEFLTTMSHELRTPLNAIGGHAQLLQLGIHGPVTPPQQDALGRIQSSQAHLLGLINDVLNFAKLDAGKVEYQIGDVPLEPLVASVAALVAPQLAAKAIRYAHTCDGTPVARADADKVRQILLNLLSNAAKFTPHGGSVTVRCTADALVTRVVVADTGVGIAREKLEHIFEPFVQVGRSLSTRHEGTGLGLAISRELARAMGGDLTVESAPNVGSAFTLRLPTARP